MLPDGVSKKIAALSTASNNGTRCKDLFRLMGNPQLWMAAYANIYDNKGAMTKGVDHNTLDGFSDERVHDLITRLKEGTYQHAPVRRMYIPKTNGKTRPLGIPIGDDKLVQEVCRMLLTAIYEPVFYYESHGFRHGHSCHTALEMIQSQWTGTKWFLSMDIEGFFNNVNHKRLLRALEEKVDDRRFLRLIQQMLEAGIMEDFKFHGTYSGTPQGGIVSPILANIYLHELDKFVLDGCKREFDRGTRREANPEYQNLSRQIERCRKRISKLMENPDPSHPDIVSIKAEIKGIERERSTLPSINPMDDGYKRLHYCRYADDVVIGIIGSKQETQILADKIETFLEKDLFLKVAKDKTQLNHGAKGIEYLSHSIDVEYSEYRKLTKRGKFRVPVRTIRGHIRLGVPTEKIEAFCRKHGYGDYKPHRWKHRTYLNNRTELEILMVYNAEIRGFANYYCLVKNVKRRLKALRSIWCGSLLATFANKRKTSLKKVRSHYKAQGWKIYYPGNKGMKSIRFFDMDQIAKPKDRVDTIPNIFTITRSRSDIIDRFNAEKCEYCGKDRGYFEVHHVKKLSNLKTKDEWQRLMIGMRRKTLILCVECHDKLHSGTLPSTRKT